MSRHLGQRRAGTHLRRDATVSAARLAVAIENILDRASRVPPACLRTVASLALDTTGQLFNLTHRGAAWEEPLDALSDRLKFVVTEFPARIHPAEAQQAVGEARRFAELVRDRAFRSLT